MNKNLFMKQVRMQLRGLPDEEVEAIIADYEDYFAEAEKNGLSEQKAIQHLGDPNVIAQNLRASFHQAPAHHSSHHPDSFRQVLLSVILLLVNIVLVLGPAVGVFGLLIGLIVMGGAFVISPLLAIINYSMGSGHLFEFFLAVALAGIGMILLPLLVTALKGAYQMLRKYIQWNLRLARGEG